MRKVKYLPFIFFLILNRIYAIDVIETRCNTLLKPMGVNDNPVFSWILSSEIRGDFQTAYQILISDSVSLIENHIGNTWNSGKIDTVQSIMIKYSGNNLKPSTRYYWKVKVWDNKNNESKWSKTNTFVTGLFSESDWKNARWIGYEDFPDSLRLVPGIPAYTKAAKSVSLARPIIPLFRKPFEVTKPIKEAFLQISGLGYYEVSLNGVKVGDALLSPNFTDYDKTCFYNTYDVTQLLAEGENVLGAIVGPGFEYNNRERYKKLMIAYGLPKLISNLIINYTDGSTENIESDDTWQVAPSPITFSGIYSGEDYDAQKEMPGWDKSGFNASGWKTALLINDPVGKLKPEEGYPIRVMEKFEPVNIYKINTDTFVYDFGQNTAGIFEITVKGNKGDKIRIKPGELVYNNGTINQKATGSPHYYEYTLRGDSIETWRPRFSFYGFRYIQVEGGTPDSLVNNENEISIVKITKWFTRNASPYAGSFSCSDTLMNRIFTLIDYAIKSNMQSVLMDCPHREKLGWLEQTYLMGGSVHYNYDIYLLYKKMVNDMIDAQYDNGLIPDIAPEYVTFEEFFYITEGFVDSPEWGSAGIIVPWLLYKWYDDVDIMKKAWPMMKRYIKYLDTKADNNILSHGLGDWYDLGPEPPGFSQLTPMGVTATSIYYYDLVLMAEIADVLGYDNEIDIMRTKAQEVKKSFNDLFFDKKTNTYASGSQTAMAMPLNVGLVDGEYKNRVIENLVDSIKANNKSLTAGDIGFHYLIQTLTDEGYSQLIYEMNNRDDVPGYGYQIRMGATALAESWQALPSKSNNHLMLGHLMQWFYEGLGGLSQDENSVAYKNIIIRPEFIEGIDSVKVIYYSPYGKITSGWIKEGKNIELNIKVPVNSTAKIIIPAQYETIKEQGNELEKIKEISNIENLGDKLQFNITSGEYSFIFVLNN